MPCTTQTQYTDKQKGAEQHKICSLLSYYALYARLLIYAINILNIGLFKTNNTRIIIASSILCYVKGCHRPIEIPSFFFAVNMW